MEGAKKKIDLPQTNNLYQRLKNFPEENTDGLVRILSSEPFNPRHNFYELPRTRNSLLDQLTIYLRDHGGLSSESRAALKRYLNENITDENELKRINYGRMKIKQCFDLSHYIPPFFETIYDDLMKISFLRGVWNYNREPPNMIEWMTAYEIASIYIHSGLKNLGPVLPLIDRLSIEKQILDSSVVYSIVTTRMDDLREKTRGLLGGDMPGEQMQLFEDTKGDKIRGFYSGLKPHEQAFVLLLFGSKLRKYIKEE